MRKRLILVVSLILFMFTGSFYGQNIATGQTFSFSWFEEGFEEPEENVVEEYIHPRLRGLENWKRPEGPLKVGLQVGHLNAPDAPEEQINLRQNLGTEGGGTTEVAINEQIAEKTKVLLEKEGILVELLPTTIPPNFWADVFVTIHADGNLNTSVSGYKIAAPRRDHTGKAEELAYLITEEYGKATGLQIDSNITSNMRGYYAFNWRRYDHSIHPMVPAAIVETGFLTNRNDRRIIVNDQDKSAEGIANGILSFLGKK